MERECAMCQLGPGPHIEPERGTCDILVVGEAPGGTEKVMGKPFVGTSGKFLRWNWENVFKGTKWLRPWVTNVVLCKPPGNRDPKKVEVEACRANFMEVFNQRSWECVVLLGDVAIRTLLNTTFKRNGPIPVEKDGVIYYPMPHPAMVLRKREWIPYFRWFSLRLRKWLERGFRFEPAFDQLVMPGSRNEAVLWIEAARNSSGFVGLDIETAKGMSDDDVVDPFDPEARVIGCSFAFKDRADQTVAVFLSRSLMEDESVKDGLSRLFASKKVVIQNAQFDMSFLERAGVKTAPVARDTKLALWLIHTDAPRKDLAFLQGLYTFVRQYKDEFRLGGKVAVGSLSSEDLALYNALDASILLKIAKAQDFYVPRKKLPWGQTLEEWVLELQYIAVQMKLRGIRVDEGRLEQISEEITPKLEEVAEFFRKMGVNPRSHKQLTELFFGKLKLKSAPGKGRSLDKEALAWLRERYPDCEELAKLAEFRELDQIKKNFLKKLPVLIKSDGKLHPNWVTDGTGTGRWSCKEPNMQQIPKWMRDFVLCTLAGDYDRMELWALAYDADDYELQETLAKADVHEEVRQEISRNLGREVARRQAKTVVFGYVYGQTPTGLARRLGITVKEAEIFQASLERRFPRLKEWKERRIKEAADKGYLETPFGLRRYVEKPTQALNYPIQSTAACVALRAVQLCYRRGWNIIMQVHDQLVFDDPNVPRDEFEELARNACPFIGEFPIEAKTGSNWKEVS